MIEQTVNSILEAEDEAKRRVADAEQRAAQIVNDGEIAAEAIRKTAAEQNKAYFAKQSAAIDAEAASVAATKLAEDNAVSDSENAAYAANVDKAVQVILEQLYK